MKAEPYSQDFGTIADMAFDSAGDLWFMTNYRRLHKWDIDGELVTEGPSIVGWSPTSIAIDTRTDDIVVASLWDNETYDSALARFDRNLNRVTNSPVFSPSDRYGIAFPESSFFSPDGSYYVSDGYHIVEVDPWTFDALGETRVVQRIVYESSHALDPVTHNLFALSGLVLTEYTWPSLEYVGETSLAQLSAEAVAELSFVDRLRFYSLEFSPDGEKLYLSTAEERQPYIIVLDRVVPEPATISLGLTVFVALLAWRRRKLP
jgi:WD40 repeat protein